MGCLYCVTVKNSSHGDALLSDQKIKQCVLNLDREIPKLRISHNANFRNIKQSAVGCCIFLFFFFHHFQINHAPDPLLLFNLTVTSNNKETKVEDIALPYICHCH